MAQTEKKPDIATGYVVASHYDEATGRLILEFPEFTEEERAFRVALMKRTLAHRNAQQPLGITTAELVREARTEAYGDDA